MTPQSNQYHLSSHIHHVLNAVCHWHWLLILFNVKLLFNLPWFRISPRIFAFSHLHIFSRVISLSLLSLHSYILWRSKYNSILYVGYLLVQPLKVLIVVSGVDGGWVVVWNAVSNSCQLHHSDKSNSDRFRVKKIEGEKNRSGRRWPTKIMLESRNAKS